MGRRAGVGVGDRGGRGGLEFRSPEVGLPLVISPSRPSPCSPESVNLALGAEEV